MITHRTRDYTFTIEKNGVVTSTQHDPDPTAPPNSSVLELEGLDATQRLMLEFSVSHLLHNAGADSVAGTLGVPDEADLEQFDAPAAEPTAEPTAEPVSRYAMVLPIVIALFAGLLLCVALGLLLP